MFGEEDGTRLIADSLPNAKHVPTVKRNRFGTPLINDLFVQTSIHAASDWVAYANCDIILPPTMPQLVDLITQQIKSPFVLAGRRWNIDVDFLIDFENPDWFNQLESRFANNKTLYSTAGMDLFVFPNHFYDKMPPFSIGWPGAKYDNWLVWYARHRKIPIIDITSAISIYHQNHPVGGGSVHPEKWEEHHISLKLLGGYGRSFDIRDTTHIALPNGRVIKRALSLSMIPVYLKRMIQRLRDRFIRQWP
ncbi:hypothetical protein EBR57_06950 [bacterium]|nr:hypothetical protein [bacterium]